ncbi:MAG: hypothetical protein LC659_10825 [Myxococcales bacterium]|nr:hypothetical protein [Myxococcales bacterium]
MERNFAELVLVVLLDRARLATVRLRLPACDDLASGAAPVAVPVASALALVCAAARDDDVD